MKTCPLNKVVTWDGPIATQVASWFGINARWAKPYLVPIAVWLDDKLGHGIRNPKKKWWLDLEVVDGVCVEPRKGVNKRDLDLDRHIDAKTQKIAYYPANKMPPPNSHGMAFVPNRKEAIAAATQLETPDEARSRIAAGGAKPMHYVPTPPLAESELSTTDNSAFNPYKNKEST